jgi:GntR family transcriptional regulator
MLAELGLSREAGTPLYLQLAHGLRDQIAGGTLTLGSALPSERDLSTMVGMSRVTVRKAIETLIDEGLLIRRQGSGTFVARRIVAPGSQLSSFSDDARARGDDISIIWIVKAYAEASEEEADALAMMPGARVARLTRVRLSGGEPLAIEHAVVPAAFLPDLDHIGTSLYEALDAVGRRPVSGQQRIRASLATATEAGILSIAERAEILRIERRTASADGSPVEFTRSAYRGDRYDFVTDLSGNAPQ